jgi:hypothetical protein
MTKLSMVRSLVLGLATIAAPVASRAGIFISVGFGPPALPVYVQPVCPAPGYIWTPGYWAYSDLSGYYWVPGTWALAPQPGYLWTPPYWGFAGGVYGFHPGYWGLHVGFYGGVNYGFGYGGVGFVGGVWNGGVFRYNTAVSNVNVTVIHNTYNQAVINNNVSRVSYNGGPGGVNARASAQEMAAERENHLPATSMQAQHEHAAAGNRQQWASQNHGNPAFGASSRPGEFGHSAAAGRPVANPAAHSAPVNHVASPAAHQQVQSQAHSQPQGQSHSQPQAQVHSQSQGQAGHQQSQGQGKPAAGQKGEHSEHGK